MFAGKTPSEPTALDEAIASALKDLSTFTADAEEYATIVDQLTKLHALKEEPNKFHWKNIDPNTLVLAGANVFGILAIVEFERVGVITSKALGFIGKLK